MGRSGRCGCRCWTGWDWGPRSGLASGFDAPGLGAVPQGAGGAATEVSRGKDTPSGHWELAGVPVPWDWTYFPDTHPAFAPDLMALVARLAGTGGILGQLPCLGRADHCDALRRASADGLADLLYLGGFGVPDCRA
jgi:phosphopentomutase